MTVSQSARYQRQTYHANGSGKLVVELVNVLVKRSPVQSSVRKVVIHVLEDEEEGELGGHEQFRRERDLVRGHAEIGADGVEEPDLRCLGSKVGDEN
jgi:hypothetical protein